MIIYYHLSMNCTVPVLDNDKLQSLRLETGDQA